jgi:hypothetical protein
MKLTILNGPITGTKILLTEKQLQKRLKFLEHKRKHFEKIGLIFEAYTPADQVNKDKDIAFGVTKSMNYLDATMVTDPEGNTPPKTSMGMISHGQLLAMSGKSKDANDPKPTDDYIVRGIVKANLDGMIIFWESNQELLRRMPYLKQALKGLLDRSLIKDTNEIWGSNEKEMLANVFEIFQN